MPSHTPIQNCTRGLDRVSRQQKKHLFWKGKSKIITILECMIVYVENLIKYAKTLGTSNLVSLKDKRSISKSVVFLYFSINNWK